MSPPLIDCAQISLRLTERACAKFWQLSNPAAPPIWAGRHHCFRCPAGAARAGGAVDVFGAVRYRLAPVCARCRRSTERGDRKVAIVKGRLCVSCYNREREVIRGRNGKGTVPHMVASRLHAASIVVVVSGGVERVDRQISAGVLELVIERGRHVRAPTAFGWAPPLGRAA